MKITKPKPQKPSRVYLIAHDADGVLPSKSTTLYDTTPEAAIAWVRGQVAQKENEGAQRGTGTEGATKHARQRTASVRAA